jgi:hypothetical protein
MSRSLLLYIPLGLLVVAAGCTMCANSYDECGPTFTGRCPQQCKSTARAGSILSAEAYLPNEPAALDEEWSSDGAGQVPGKVLSITDRKVDKPPIAASPAAELSAPVTSGWKSKAAVKTPAAPIPVPERD